MLSLFWVELLLLHMHTNTGWLKFNKLPGVLFIIAGLQSDQQMELFRILAALLHLGNVNIQAHGRSSERSSIDVRNVAFLMEGFGSSTHAVFSPTSYQCLSYNRNS